MNVDVAVIGGTPGGITAALAAAHAGMRVALTEYHAHIGGMAASGLGKSDIENRDMIGGLFTEFIGRVRAYYADKFGEGSKDFERCCDGYYYEPSVAEKIFNEMLAEESDRITVLIEHRLEAVEVKSNRVQRARLQSRRDAEMVEIEAKVFIDATYEGDLYAMAGADYRLGRESQDEFGEPHAGVVYYDYENGEFLPGTTGEGDDRLPAYTYRLCFTTDQDNSYVLDSPPLGYDRKLYTPYFEDLEAGRLSAPKKLVEGWGYYPAHFDTLMRAFSVTDIPNQKVDANINPRPLAFPFPEENWGYVEAGWERREEICRRHRNIALGLLYFLQNDEAIPENHRQMARKYHLPLDEFVDNEHFPFQLYVREARRLVGEYTLTEHDITRGNGADAAGFPDSIAVGEFPIDSFPYRKRQPGDTHVLEGYMGMLDHITRPYGIPYRIMIPKQIDGLIVSVAASTTHVAYSSIRLEPTWMAMGQAAGNAAALAVREKCPPRNVSITELQAAILCQGGKLSNANVGDTSQLELYMPQSAT